MFNLCKSTFKIYTVNKDIKNKVYYYYYYSSNIPWLQIVLM